MSNISITFSIWHVCLLFLALVAGVLIGCFATLCIFKWAFANKVSTKGEKNGRKLRRERQKAVYPVKPEIEDEFDEDFEDYGHEITEQDESQIPYEQEELSLESEPAEEEEGYQEGSVLKKKMDRSRVLNLFDLGASADGVSLEERLKARQSKEDASYSILKNARQKKE